MTAPPPRRGAPRASAPGSPRACCRPSDRSVRPCRYTRIRTWGSGARSLPDQVAAFILRAIEGLIGERHEAVGTLDAIVGKRRESDADRNVDGIIAGIGKITILHAQADAFGEDGCALRRRLGHHDDELLAAVPGHDVYRTHLTPQQLTDLSQHGIARDVAEIGRAH